MLKSKSKYPRHGHVFSPESRAMFAYLDGHIKDTDVSALEAGKFFPATEVGLTDPVAPDDIISGGIDEDNPIAMPLDGQIASAGWPDARLLDEPGTFWRKHDVSSGGTLTMSWNYHAQHLTRRWNYFITKRDWDPNQKLSRAQFESQPFYKVELSAQPFWAHPEALWPPKPTVHDIILPDRQGYHVMLAVWEVADTGAAFYQVIDLNFTGEGGGEGPSTPAGLHAVEVTETTIELAWSASSGSYPIRCYTIHRNGTVHARVDASELTFLDTGLAPDTEYSYFISAKDEQGNESLPSQEIKVRTRAEGGEDTPPTPPKALHSMGETANSVRLMWGGSSGSNAIKNYYVYRDGVRIGTTAPSRLDFTDTQLNANTEYRYFVAAIDVRDHLSLPSNVLIVSTTGEGGDIPEWSANSTRYEVNDKVRYLGKVYECIQAHTSNSGWSPTEAFTLWREVAGK